MGQCSAMRTRQQSLGVPFIIRAFTCLALLTTPV